MRKGHVRPVAGLVLVLGMLLSGLWMPVSADEASEAGASTPVVLDEGVDGDPATPAETGGESSDGADDGSVGEDPGEAESPSGEEPDAADEPSSDSPDPAEDPVGEADAPPAEDPSGEAPEGDDSAADQPQVTPAGGTTVAPSRMQPQEVNAQATATVTINVTTDDDMPFPADRSICVWNDDRPQCSPMGVSSATFTVAAGEIYYWIYADGYLDVDEFVEVAAGEALTLNVTLERLRLVDVTFNISTSDGGAVPADSELCVWDREHYECAEPGATSFTTEVVAQRFSYEVWNADPYMEVYVWDASIDGPTTIDIVLLPAPPRFLNITTTWSDANPEPGSQITFTVHVWGTTSTGFLVLWSELYGDQSDLTDLSITCSFTVGALDWPKSCDDMLDEEYGNLDGAIRAAGDGSYDGTIVVTGTVPDAPGDLLVGVACAMEGWVERTALAGGPDDPITGEECAAVTAVIAGAEAELATVTVNVVMADRSPVPAGTVICGMTSTAFNLTCSNPGAASHSFTTAYEEFPYLVMAPGYATVQGDEEVTPGESHVIYVVLEPADASSGLNITKTVSDDNPWPGSRVTYEIHIWGSGDVEYLEMLDFLPAELSAVRVSCEMRVGWAALPGESCVVPIDGLVMGAIAPDYDEDTDAFVYDALVTVTGTVTDAPGVTFTNTACVLGEGLDEDLHSACDAATLTTRVPEPGTWGAAALSVDVAEAKPGDTVTYTLTLPWAAAETVARDGILAFAQAALPTFGIVDPVPATLTGVTWTCEGENATCDPESGTGNAVAVEGAVIDPAQDALITLTITGTVVDDAVVGEVLNVACVRFDAVDPAAACDQEPAAAFTVLAQPVDPVEPTPTPTDPVTPTPTDPASPTPTDPATPSPTATPDGTPVTGLPKTGAAPGAGAGSTLGLVALLAAALLGAGAYAVRGGRVRR